VFLAYIERKLAYDQFEACELSQLFVERILSMQIRHLIIPSKVLAKLEAQHNVKKNEVQEVFRNRATKYEFVEEGHFQGEDVYSASGQTEAGRYLVVFFIKKPHQTALCISARDMDKKERRRYGKK
jgi:uncharacterized DUF497 family protein